MTLNNLGLLYRQTQRLKEVEEASQEALTIRRRLAQANPPAYLPNVATTLNNLACSIARRSGSKRRRTSIRKL